MCAALNNHDFKLTTNKSRPLAFPKITASTFSIGQCLVYQAVMVLRVKRPTHHFTGGKDCQTGYFSLEFFFGARCVRLNLCMRIRQ